VDKGSAQYHGDRDQSVAGCTSDITTCVTLAASPYSLSADSHSNITTTSATIAAPTSVHLSTLQQGINGKGDMVNSAASYSSGNSNSHRWSALTSDKNKAGPSFVSTTSNNSGNKTLSVGNSSNKKAGATSSSTSSNQLSIDNSSSIKGERSIGNNSSMNGATTGGSSISGEPKSGEPCVGTYGNAQPPTAADAGLSEQDHDAYAAQTPALVALLTSKAWPKGRNTTSIPVRVFGKNIGTSVINTTALIDTGSDISAMSLVMATSTALKGVPLQPLQAGDFKTVAGVEQGNGVKLIGRMELMITVSDVDLAAYVYVAEALPVSIILGGDFQRVHSASMKWCKGVCHYTAHPKATPIVTTSGGQGSGSNVVCTGLAIAGASNVPVTTAPARPITCEREALLVRSKITAAGGTLVLTQAEHGAAGALVTMEDIVVKRGTKLTINLRSTVVPKLAARPAAIVTPTQAYNMNHQHEQQQPSVSVGHCTVSFTQSKPVPVTLLNVSKDDVNIPKGVTMATLVEADYQIEGVEEAVNEVIDSGTDNDETMQGDNQSGVNAQLVQALHNKLAQIVATVKLQEAKRRASITGSKTTLTLEEQDLRSMYKSIIDGDTKEHRDAHISAHSDWLNTRSTLEGKTLKEVVHDIKYDVLTAAQRDQVEAMLCARGQVEAMLCARGAVLPLIPKAPAAIAPGFEIGIETGDAKPVRTSSKGRRFANAELEEMRERIDFWLKEGIVTPSTSPWCAPLVAARKKDGSLRLCVDFRGLNAVTQKDAFVLPRIDDIFNSDGGSRLLFSNGLSKWISRGALSGS
jgi:hypothetical protein